MWGRVEIAACCAMAGAYMKASLNAGASAKLWSQLDSNDSP